MSEAYINFYPQSNLLHGFPLAGRAYWLAADAAGLPAWLALRAVLPAEMSASVCRSGAAVLVATVDADPALRKLYDQRCWDSAPSSFVLLLEDPERPALWFGGVTSADLIATLDFVREYFTFLREKILAAADFHVHSRVSDGWGEPEELPALALAARLDVLALTDHNTTAGYERLRQAAAAYPSLLTVCGMEVTDSRHNHLLAFGEVENLPHSTPEVLLQAARSGRVFLAQAHATSDGYFTDVATGTAMGAEAFNYLSSAPEQARDYLRRRQQDGLRVTALGNSDTHMVADLGKARTFLRLDAFTAENVIAQLRQGACCAFCKGEFLGEPALEKILQEIYRRSDLLDGKLVAEAAYWRQPSTPGTCRVDAVGVHELVECEQRQLDRRRIYCPVSAECLCREHYYRLPAYQPGARVRCGDAAALVLTINESRRRVLLQTGEGENLRPYVRSGLNRLEFASLPDYHYPLRLCLGRELREWEIRLPQASAFQPVGAAGNLQVQGVVPHGAFAGELLLRTRVANPERADRLFCESIDGNIRLLVNGQEITRRFGTHWEERFEVAIPPDPELEIVVVLRNHVGLCGISNHVYLGTSQPMHDVTMAFPLKKIPDLCELRWSEQRTRSFLLDVDYKIVGCFFNLGDWQPIPSQAVWLMAADFSTPSRTRVQWAERAQ